MQFLLDENLPRSVATLFRVKGHEVIHVLDSSLRGSSDEIISEQVLILKLASSVLNQIALMPDLKERLILVEENQIRVR